ncbi:MAG: HD-GYP domain-containing protein [Nitrospira sp.]|nr:HD-GYP domain-containing protein [Nitrospira sp.]
MIKKVKINQLEKGMYIHDFNCGWLDHPFFGSSMKIASTAEIHKIESNGIREVYIDTEKGEDVSDAPTSQEVRKSIDNEIQTLNENDTDSGPIAAIDDEICNAREVLKDASQTVSNLMDEIKQGRQLETENVELIVSRMSESIFRNKNALMCLGKIKQSDEYTFVHSVNVCVLMISFAQHLGLSAEEIHSVGVGGLLHDIGKMKIAHEILNKPGKLTDSEFEAIQKHVVFGREILETTGDIDESSMNMAYQHHERIDGSGYPEKLSGDKISLYGKMGAIADVYDAITSKRCYKGKIEPTECLKKMLEWSQYYYDNELVGQFIRCVGIYPVGTLVRMESGKLGIVLQNNDENLLAPKVRIIYDTRKSRYIMPTDIDLNECAGKAAKERVACCESPEKWGVKIESYL